MISRTIAATTHGRYLVEPAATAGAAPLVVGFHGYAENAEAMLERLRGMPGSDRLTLVAVEGLHRFYRGRSTDVVASWMTRADRELAIADNRAYVRAVVDAVAHDRAIAALFFAGFSQGVAMAFRAAAAVAGSKPARVIALGGDVPPELTRTALASIAGVLIGRGARDEWYTREKREADVARLTDAGIAPRVVEIAGGHEWTAEFSRAAADFVGG